MFEKERNINFGPAELCENGLNQFSVQFQDSLQTNYKLNSNNQWVIAFCSRTMLNSAKLSDITSKVICIDSTGGMDRSSGHLFNLVIPGPTGGLSIGMFITFSETKTDIKLGLEFLKETWQKNSIVVEPTCFMSDDCSAQIAALSEIFPNSTTLLCQFHVVQAL